MDWKDHVQAITASARSTLGVLQKNMSSYPRQPEGTCQALVRPKLKYSAAAWNPYTSGQVNSFEAVQRQAARFVTNNFGRTASVTSILQDLQWDSLADYIINAVCFIRSNRNW